MTWLSYCYYRKFPKYLDTQKFVVITLKFELCGSTKSNESKRCSRNGKQCRPWSAVWSGSALFAQAYLSENLGSLRYKVYLDR